VRPFAIEFRQIAGRKELMQPADGEVTRLLAELRSNPGAASELIPLVYDHLHRLAESYMRRERPDHTLQATLLADEACLRLLSRPGVDCQNQAQLFCMAANVMRQILVDHARARQTAKRGGKLQKLSLDSSLEFPPERSKMLIQLDDALKSLERIDRQQAQIVELRFFGGLTEEETAKVLGISPRTVRRDWRVARSWLYGELSSEERKSERPPRGENDA
jgi:RNA polymerase sigma-70 factor (ECF subfamily)